jgi:hypothetical protein
MGRLSVGGSQNAFGADRFAIAGWAQGAGDHPGKRANIENLEVDATSVPELQCDARHVDRFEAKKKEPAQLPAAPEPPPAPSSTYPDVCKVLSERLDYRVERGKVSMLVDNTIIEGNASHGGRRPHYLVDLSHPGMKKFLDRVDALKLAPEATSLEKADGVAALVREMLPNRSQVGTKYRRLLRKARGRQDVLSLGEFIEGRVGLGHEHAFLMNIALRRLGVKAQLSYVTATRQHWGIPIRHDHAINVVTERGQQMVYDSYFTDLQGKPLKAADEARRTSIVPSSRPHGQFFLSKGQPADVKVSVPTQSGTLDFEVYSQGQGKRRFEQEAEVIAKASGSDPVPLEWIFVPHYHPLGHTVLRVGKEIYHFTKSSGWKVQDAKQFLFNNPYFDAQRERWGEHQIPPFTMGVPLTMSADELKSVLAAIKESKEGAESFRMLSNNCNSHMLRTLGEAVHATNASGFEAFSAPLTFRRLMFDDKVRVGAPTMYVIPGQDNRAMALAPRVPEFLTASRAGKRELVRLAKKWPHAEIVDRVRSLMGKAVKPPALPASA